MKKIVTLFLFVGSFTLGFSQSDYYNDYRRSINDYDWTAVIADLVLSPQQKDQLFALNNRYDDYNSWNRVYGSNPDRWRTDRYNEMERIFGTTKYTKFKNKYYKGQNPVAVYNRNKNNYKPYQNKGKKTTPIYRSTKKSSNSSHANGKAKAHAGHGNSNGKGKNK